MKKSNQKINVNQHNGARLVVQCLEQQGVRIVFGIPGAKIDAVFDALMDSSIKLVICRHEQNAVFMAAAYGRLTGRPGVVLVTSGPGVSNCVTGLLTATTEGDPVIAIGGNVSRAMQLKSSHQSTDNIKLVEAVTKARMNVVVAETIPEIIDNAFRIAMMPRSGAVFISLPQDISLQHIESQPLKCIGRPHYGVAPLDVIQKVAEQINQAKRPIFLLGLEASRPQTTHSIRTLLRKCPFGVVCTFQGAGVISRDLLTYFAGRVGLFKNQPGDQLIDSADLIVTIGYSPVEYDPEIWNSKNLKHIIHIDNNLAEIHASYAPELEVLGDISSNIDTLATLLKSNKAPDYLPWIQSLQTELMNVIERGASISGTKIHPLRFINELQKIADDNTIVISDIGSHYMWLARYYLCFQPHHLLFSNGQQTLGVAIPWAIAAGFVDPKQTIISISGDGGFLFSAMEMETAVREKIHFIHFVWCDGAYNMVQEQELMKYQRDSGVHFGPVDIVKFAESFGATGFRVNHANELAIVIAQAKKIKGPVLVEVPIDYSENHLLFTMSDDRTMN